MSVELMIATVMIVLAFIVAFVRMLKGPSLPDRVVALDLMATLAVGMICLSAIAAEQFIFLDAAMVLALILFLSTIAFAYYIKKKGGTA